MPDECEEEEKKTKEKKTCVLPTFRLCTQSHIDEHNGWFSGTEKRGAPPKKKPITRDRSPKISVTNSVEYRKQNNMRNTFYFTINKHHHLPQQLNFQP